MRRRWTRMGRLAVALVVLTPILSACASSSSGGSSGGDTLIIGAPLALTGPIAEQAKQMNNSFKLYLNQHGNKLGGVKVDLRVEDSQGDPNVTVTKTRKLIQNDKVTMSLPGLRKIMVGLSSTSTSFDRVDSQPDGASAFL